MTDCSAIQNRLAEQGAAALDPDAELRRHVADCAACTRFLADLRQVESAIGQLPLHDAPDSVVADTLHAVRRAPRDDRATAAFDPNRGRLAGTLAAALVLAAAVGLVQDLPIPPAIDRGFDLGFAVSRQVAAPESALVAELKQQAAQTGRTVLSIANRQQKADEPSHREVDRIAELGGEPAKPVERLESIRRRQWRRNR